MKWGKGIAVVLVVLMVCGLLVRVPVAKAGTLKWFKVVNQSYWVSSFGGAGYGIVTIVGCDETKTPIASWFSGISIASRSWSAGGHGFPGGDMTAMAGDNEASGNTGWASVSCYKSPVATFAGASVAWSTAFTVSGVEYHLSVESFSVGTSAVHSEEVWIEAEAYVPPVSVELSGPNLVVPSLGFLYTATISGGTTPYAVQFSKMKSGGTSYWYYDAVNTSSTVVQQYISFDQVGTYTARVVVIDGKSTSVQDTMTVTVVERKPDLWGVVLIEGGELQFALSGAEGGAKPEWGYGVYYPTSVYTVNAPSWRARESDHYTLDLDAPYPNPLVVAVRYTDPSTGSAWDYQFTFDMTDVDEEDEWIDSNGVGEVSLVDTLPEWLKAVLDGIRDVFEKLFRWLFVPTSEQVSDLLPSGSLGASLLDGVAWTGAEAGEYTLHGHWTVNGSEVEVPLVSFNVSSVAASPFVGVVRKIVQAGVCLALVYMVVVLV